MDNDRPMRDEDGQILPSNVTLFDFLLPPQAVVLAGILILMTPMILLTGESLLLPLFEYAKTIFIPGSKTTLGALPFTYFLKLGAFLILTFFALIQLGLRLKTVYYTIWSVNFPRPHRLHVDYQPDSQQSMLALLNWYIYRVLVVVGPPLALALITTLVLVIQYTMFVTFIDQTFMSLPLQIIVAMFVMFVLMILTVYALIYSLWNMFTTVFGDVIAITEPDLPAKTAFDRSRRIAFKSPFTWFLYPCYAVFVGVVCYELFLLFFHYDIHDLIGFKVNLPLILFLEVLTFAFYLLMNFFKFYTYHRSLAEYYDDLPPSFAQTFEEPPPLWSEGFAEA
ncbi:MAG: hypothetical protein KTR14_05005 [Vampirovibrio sp.]|nr:hypothetical protein [Vampirovibrio sp.]